jgi:hypothetical protein
MSYVVEVNEANVALYSTKAVAEWWNLFRLRHHGTGRITDRSMSVVGGYASVACDDREHAEELAAHLVSHGGLNKAAVRVRPAAPDPTHPIGDHHA